jgi:hypothetical protein
MAAHRDSVLLQIVTGGDYIFAIEDDYVDYFLYCAGNASRPPSLSLLPPRRGHLFVQATGLLRRGQDETLVAALGLRVEKGDEVLEVELCSLRSGDWEWEHKRLPVLHDEGKR